MATHGNKFSNPLIWAASIAVILFCGVGIAAVMGWIPTSMGQPGNDAALTQHEKKQVSQAKTPSRPRSVASQKCTHCGVIASGRAINTKGEGSGLGAVGGAVVGGLLGNQVGKGHGRELATVVGAVGGVMAGNEIEKRTRSTTSYEITVRMDDGSQRVIQEVNAPTWQAGDRVKIVDSTIRSA
jgi:outer membrane lipoprotein SlyB